MSMIGATVKVDRKFVHNDRGVAVCKSFKPAFQRIEQVFIGGKVMTNTGDVWRITLNPNQNESRYVITGEPTGA